MATQTPENVYSLPAAADLSDKQFRFIVINAAGKIALAGAGADKISGILQNEPLADEQARYRWGGTQKVKSGGNIAAGAYVTSDANGDAVATVTAGDPFFGIAVEAAVAGDIFRISWQNGVVP